MFISSRGAQVGDVVEDRRGKEWVLIGIDYTCGGNLQIHFIVRRAKIGSTWPVTRVTAMDAEEFDKFQREGPT